jgi:hypothetical protein
VVPPLIRFIGVIALNLRYGPVSVNANLSVPFSLADRDAVVQNA